MKKKALRDLVSQDINQSKALRQMRDENQRMLDMNDEEKAKNNYTYFNGYD